MEHQPNIAECLTFSKTSRKLGGELSAAPGALLGKNRAHVPFQAFLIEEEKSKMLKVESKPKVFICV